MAKIVFRDPITRSLIQEHEVERWLFSEETEFQQVDILESKEFGMALALGGVINVTERDEAAYHEMLAHVPMLSHPDPKRVLIIGGGDGGTLREIVKYDCIEEVVMVEIDEVVVNVCKEYLPEVSDGAFEHEKANLIIGDGLKYVADAEDESFDIILVDSTDPVDAAVELFTEEFYRDCHRVLKKGGILVPQSDAIFHYGKRVYDIVQKLRGIYDSVDCYLSFVTGYPSGVWTFSYASKGANPTASIDLERHAAIEGSLRYYTPELHRASFVLPKSYQRCIEEGVEVGR